MSALRKPLPRRGASMGKNELENLLRRAAEFFESSKLDRDKKRAGNKSGPARSPAGKS